MKVTPGSSVMPQPVQVAPTPVARAPSAPAAPAPGVQPPPAQALRPGDTFGSPQPARPGPQLGSNLPGPQVAVPPSPQETVAHLGEEPPVSEACEEQAREGWKKTSDAVEQTTATDCGGASIAYLNKADGYKPGTTEKQLRDEVRHRVSELNGSERVRSEGGPINLSNGATPDEMGAALGGMGMQVVRGFGNYDSEFMSQAIGRGQLGLAQVDSHALANANLPPGKQQRGPGELHWVTIDGIDTGRDQRDRMDDRFRVKDPVNGEYWLTAHELQRAIEQGRQHHGGGGVLVVDKRPDVTTRAQREALALENLKHTSTLGDKPGIGSRRFSGSVSN
jgi:hypothetical protein